MADAKITVVVTPTEFDLIRAAILDSVNEYMSLSKSTELDPMARRAAREKSAQLKLIHARLV